MSNIANPLSWLKELVGAAAALITFATTIYANTTTPSATPQDYRDLRIAEDLVQEALPMLQDAQESARLAEQRAIDAERRLKEARKQWGR